MKTPDEKLIAYDCTNTSLIIVLSNGVMLRFLAECFSLYLVTTSEALAETNMGKPLTSLQVMDLHYKASRALAFLCSFQDNPKDELLSALEVFCADLYRIYLS